MSVGLHALAVRDALGLTLLLASMVFFGSGRLTHLDPALFGYLGAAFVCAAAGAYRVSLFWRRPATAAFGRAFLRRLRTPRRLVALSGVALRTLGSQNFLFRRGRLRGAAHLALAWGTLLATLITFPLVFGWLQFRALDTTTYQAVMAGIPIFSFPVEGIVAFLVFHALVLCSLLVVFGSLYFLGARLLRRGETGALGSFHLAPLMLLLMVALTGLALPWASRLGALRVFDLMIFAHEACVIFLLAAMPWSKLAHIFGRPLQIGAAELCAPGQPWLSCESCHSPLASVAQLELVEQVLARRGMHFAGVQRVCAPCRRRRLARVQSALSGNRFQPTPVPRRSCQAA